MKLICTAGTGVKKGYHIFPEHDSDFVTIRLNLIPANHFCMTEQSLCSPAEFSSGEQRLLFYYDSVLCDSFFWSAFLMLLHQFTLVSCIQVLVDGIHDPVLDQRYRLVLEQAFPHLRILNRHKLA